MLRTFTICSTALLAVADAMSSPVDAGFQRDVATAATAAGGDRGGSLSERRSLRGGGRGNGGNRRNNDINICSQRNNGMIPVDRVTGTIHDDAVRAFRPLAARRSPLACLALTSSRRTADRYAHGDTQTPARRSASRRSPLAARRSPTSDLIHHHSHCLLHAVRPIVSTAAPAGAAAPIPERTATRTTWTAARPSSRLPEAPSL